MKTNFWPAFVMIAMLAWTVGCQEPEQPQGPAQPPPEQGDFDLSPRPGSGLQPNDQSSPGARSPSREQNDQLPGAGSFPSQPQGQGQSSVPSPSRFEVDSPAEENLVADDGGLSLDDSSFSFEEQADSFEEQTDSFSFEEQADAEAAFPSQSAAADSPSSSNIDDGADGADDVSSRAIE